MSRVSQEEGGRRVLTHSLSIKINEDRVVKIKHLEVMEISLFEKVPIAHVETHRLCG
jgi:hypothetical protein